MGNTYTDKESLKTAILSTPYMGSYTNTSGGIRVAIESVFTQDGGDRPDVTNLAIIITDGASNKDVGRLPGDASNLQSVATVVAIGITDAVNETELALLASAEEDIIKTPSFDDLDSIIGPITKSICETNT